MNIKKMVKLKKLCSRKQDFSNYKYKNEIIDSYFEALAKMYLKDNNAFILLSRLISIENKLERNKENYESVRIKVGDICEIDFGDNYVHESGFQHLAVVLKIINQKAFVVPLTSNIETTMKAYAHKRNHLMYIGKVNGLNKESCIFLNDARYISLKRVIDVKGHIPIRDHLFEEIKRNVIRMII